MARGNIGTLGTGAGATITPGAPASLSVGDILICVITQRRSAGSAPSMTTAGTEWTQIYNQLNAGNSVYGAAYWHRYAGVAPNYQVTSGDSGQNILARVVAYSGRKTSGSPVDASTSQSQSTATSWTVPAITTTVDNCDVLFNTHASSDNNRTATSGSDPAPTSAFNSTISGSLGLSIWDGTQTTHGSTGARTTTYGGNQNGDVGVIALAPQSDTPPTAGFTFVRDRKTVALTRTSVQGTAALDTFEVDWGDGTVNSLLTHTYSVGGTYTITLTETDAGALTDDFSDDVTTTTRYRYRVQTVGGRSATTTADRPDA